MEIPMSRALFLLCLLLGFQGEACTAFQIKAKDGTLVYGRSLEFAFPLDSDLLIAPRGMDYTGTAPGAKPGLKWKSRYGYVGMNQSFAKTLVSDGMNEKGLIASVLYLPGLAEYEAPDSARTARTLGIWELPTFLLGTCANIEEVKAVLPTVLVAQEPMLQDFVVPLHLYVSDRKGSCIIVEYIQGVRHVYDNPLGVLTNAPSFDWHLTNLGNYINLSPFDVDSLNLPNLKVQRFGVGSGLLGLPGDFTPPSRFIRAALFSQWVQMPQNGPDAALTAFHILNTFDIFAGIIRPAPNSKPPRFGSEMELTDVTEWIIVHDHANLKTYFRTYEGLNIQMVDFKKLNFSSGTFQQIPLAKQFTVEEVSENLQPLNQEPLSQEPSD